MHTAASFTSPLAQCLRREKGRIAYVVARTIEGIERPRGLQLAHRPPLPPLKIARASLLEAKKRPVALPQHTLLKKIPNVATTTREHGIARVRL